MGTENGTSAIEYVFFRETCVTSTMRVLDTRGFRTDAVEADNDGFNKLQHSSGISSFWTAYSLAVLRDKCFPWNDNTWYILFVQILGHFMTPSGFEKGKLTK